MAKKEDPFMLENYRFISPQKQAYVDAFFNKLDDVCREFATKRYIEGKTVSQVAEEMGYTERALYVYRDRIIGLWYIYSEDERLEYHRQRLLNMLQKHGAMKHRDLRNNLNVSRSGFSTGEFRDIINQLIVSGKIVSFTSISGKRGRHGQIYKYIG